VNDNAPSMSQTSKALPSRSFALPERKPAQTGVSAAHRAYVGPEDRYDLIGAMQFRLLCALGLREHHKLMDLGCGSLRAGRLLIPYLARGNYHGVEPNDRLLQQGVEQEIGRDMIALKWPHFHCIDTFEVDACGRDFDYILAQSIFSHTGVDLLRRALASFARALAPKGLGAVTFIHAEVASGFAVDSKGWVYPGVVTYTPQRLQEEFQSCGLAGRPLPWYHPNRQTWYVLAKHSAELPDPELDRHFGGAVWRVPECADSINASSPIIATDVGTNRTPAQEVCTGDATPAIVSP
jgi:SAM-dependent methyltransferase